MSEVHFVPDGEVLARPTDLFPATTAKDWHAHADLLDASGRLVDGLRVIATPGHTPGHISVATEHVVIAGDVLHSPAQLQHPQWCFGSDRDPEQAAASRRKLLAAYGPDVLACGHFTRC
jgi:glyoxylase-like metal-dependent hydrolase (beta-lactamase superfamily II)